MHPVYRMTPACPLIHTMMQEKQFDDMLAGKPALMSKVPSDMEMRTAFPRMGSDKPVTLDPEDRAKLEAMAEPVPEALFEEIKIWVARQKTKGLSDRAIRRAVKRKWNIINYK
jgi:hypothetical protein